MRRAVTRSAWVAVGLGASAIVVLLPQSWFDEAANGAELDRFIEPLTMPMAALWFFRLR